MSKNTIIILISAFLVFVLGITFFVYSNKLINLRSKNEDSLAPQTEITDESVLGKNTFNKFLNFTIFKEDRTEIDLSEYENYPLVILFFDDKDTSSLENLKEVNSIYKRYADKIKFLVIDTNSEVNEELKDDYTIEIFYDFNQEGIKNYNVTEFPYILYIKDNNIVNTKTGVTTKDALEANLDLLSDDI